MVGGEPLVLDLQPGLACAASPRARRNAPAHAARALAAHATSSGRRLVRFDDEIEGRRLFAQARDGMFERRRRARHQPAAERQKSAAVLGRAALDRQCADEFGLLVCRCGPDDDALVAQIEQRLERCRRGVEIGDAGAQSGILRTRCGRARGSARSPRAAPRPSTPQERSPPGRHPPAPTAACLCRGLGSGEGRPGEGRSANERRAGTADRRQADRLRWRRPRNRYAPPDTAHPAWRGFSPACPVLSAA